MISFRQKQLVKDMMPVALDHLAEEGIFPPVISQDQADAVSRVNSKSLVLESFIQNESGFYQIKIRDGKFYSWTRKMLETKFRMRILDANEKERTLTAETNHLGVALEIISALGFKYNLSVVQ